MSLLLVKLYCICHVILCYAILCNSTSLKDDCTPVCDEGYHVIGQHGLSMAPDTVTCENGQWLTESEPYTGENICYPEGISMFIFILHVHVDI